MHVFWIYVQQVTFLFLLGTVLGAGDARSTTWCEVEEGSGTPVQPASHWIPANAIWNADGRHPLQTLQAAKSHGKDFLSLHSPTININFFLAVFSVWNKPGSKCYSKMITLDFACFLHVKMKSQMTGNGLKCMCYTFFFFFMISSQVNGDIPPRLKKSAHEIILEFIRSRPPLNPVSITQCL